MKFTFQLNTENLVETSLIKALESVNANINVAWDVIHKNVKFKDTPITVHCYMEESGNVRIVAFQVGNEIFTQRMK